MKKNIFLLIFYYCITNYDALAQVDEREAFKILKKQTGTWQTKGEESIFEDWQKISKHTLGIKQYQLNGADTLVLFTAKIYYFKSRTIWKQDEITYTINYTENAEQPSTTLRFVLYNLADNACTFYTYQKGIRHQLTYQAWDKNQMMRKQIIEKEETNEVLVFSRIKKR